MKMTDNLSVVLLEQPMIVNGPELVYQWRPVEGRQRLAQFLSVHCENATGNLEWS